MGAWVLRNRQVLFHKRVPFYTRPGLYELTGLGILVDPKLPLGIQLLSHVRSR